MLELLTGGLPTTLSRGIEVGFVGPDGTQVRTGLADAARQVQNGLPGADVSLLQATAVFPGQLVVLDRRPARGLRIVTGVRPADIARL